MGIFSKLGEGIEQLRAKYGDVDKINTIGNTLLHDVQTESAAKTLIERGADVNARNEYSMTPLHWIKNAEVAKLLIEHGADVNARDEDGLTPLHFAENADVAKVLIDAGADVNARDDWGSTPLEVMNEDTDFPVDDDLKEYLQSHIIHLNKELRNASWNGDVQRINDLVQRGADVRAQDEDGNNAAFHAAWYGQKDALHALVQHGADVNAQDKNGNTAIHKAAQYNRHDVVQLLLEEGASLGVENNEERSALDAVRNSFQHTEPTRLFAYEGLRQFVEKGYEQHDDYKHHIDEGMLVNARNIEGYTPLHHAKNAEIAKVLIDAGANINNAQNKRGFTPLHTTEYSDVAKVLIEHGADVSAQTRFGRTPLHHACRDGNADVAKVLIDAGADLNARDRISAENAVFAEWHIDAGIYLTNKNDENGMTPLEIAREDIQPLLREAHAAYLKKQISEALSDPGPNEWKKEAEADREKREQWKAEHQEDVQSMTETRKRRM